MNHRQLTEKLQGYHFGSLEASETAGVEAHLDGCPDCRSLSETYVALHGAIQAQRASVGLHPTAEEIVGFALSEEKQDDEVQRRVRTHLADCSSCSDEVARIRVSEASAIEADRSGSGAWAARLGLRRPGGLYALAASLLAAVLLYPAFLGLYRYPALRGRAAELEGSISETRARAEELGSALRQARSELNRVSAWAGPVDVLFLSGTLRDEAAPSEVSVDPDKPHVVLGAEFDVPRRASDTDMLRIRLTREGGAVVAEVEMSVKEAREAIRTAGPVTLLVPTARLDPGEHRLEVLYRGDDADTVLLESSFEVAQP